MSKHIQSFSLRLRVYMRDFFTCVYCKKAMNPLDSQLSLDHLDPKGADTEENLVTACRSCNSTKNQINIQELAHQIALKRGPQLVVERRMAELMAHTKQNALTLEELLSAVAKGHGTALELLVGKQRTNEKRAVLARAQFAIEARKLGYSLPNIGKALGMHHTSVLHIINKYSQHLTGFPTGIAQN